MALVDLKRGKKSRFADAGAPAPLPPVTVADLANLGWGSQAQVNAAQTFVPGAHVARAPGGLQAAIANPGSLVAAPPPTVPAPVAAVQAESVAPTVPVQPVPAKIASPYESLTSDPVAMMRMANAGGGPIVHHPAGYVPVSATTKTEEGVRLAPETKHEIERQQKTEGEAEEATAALVPQQVAAEATIAQYDANRAAQDAADQKALLDWQHQELARHKATTDQLIADANNASVGDTHKWWNDKPMAAKFATGVSMALRGFAFGMGHGSDPMKWMDDQINTSLDAQRQVADAAHNKANLNINEYARLRAQFGDDATAAEAYKLKMRQNAVAQFQAAATNQQLPEIQRLRAAAALAPLQAANVNQRVKLDELTADKIAKVDASAWQKASTTGGTADILTRLHRALELKKDLMALGPNSPEEQKADAEIAKIQAEAAELRSKAAGGGQSAQQEAQQAEALAKSLQTAGIPRAKADFAEANALTDPKTGVLDHTASWVLRSYLNTQEGGAAHAVIKQLVANHDEVRLANVIGLLADAKMKSSGGRLSVNTLPIILDQIIGRGTPEDIRAGIKGMQQEILSDEADLRAGVTPRSLAMYDQRLAEQRQQSGIDAPTGFTPAP